MSLYKDILLSVSRPSRYIGQEINSIKKDLSKVSTKVALIFPDVYEIGMSHLGLKILYHIINNIKDVAAERAFVPWIDFEEVLIERDIPIISLESSLPLREFDILGFTLPYELCYTNILTTLALSGIPLLSAERDEQYPLIIGGGTAVFNPEPVADFFDALFLGDGEEGVVDIINTYKVWRCSGTSKEHLLWELSKIEGVYIPSLYNIEYNDNWTIRSICPRAGVVEKVKRRIVEDLDKVSYPLSTPLPYMQAIHDRLTVEMARGCTHGCRFCQAGIIYRPVRERSPEKIIEIIENSLQNTGYEEVSLSSLSTGDFACLSQLLTLLVKKYAGEHVSFSLPSLRVGTLTPTIIEQVTDSKNTGFTIAPEAGTARLRKVINKEMDEGIFEATVDEVFKKGVKSLKMYFMIGLPTEDDEDLEGIVNLGRRAKDIGKRYGKGGRDITISVSTFVPKPHTPFQWYGQTQRDEIYNKINYLRSGLKRTGISFRWHNAEISYLEAVFSRGDRRLGRVIEAAWRSGCRFDSWTERFDFHKWEEAFNQCGIDPDFYALRQIPAEEILPWEHLDTVVTKEFLIKEYKRAIGGRIVSDCRYGLCPNCGVCDLEAVRGKKEEGVRPIAKRPELPENKSLLFSLRSMQALPLSEAKKAMPPIYKRGDGGIVYEGIASKRANKVRIKYSKTGDMRMLSQLEIMTTFARAFRRARIPTMFSEGFHPHPRFSFGPALPVGIESICEYMDVELTRRVVPDKLKEDLNRCLPDGLKILSVKDIPYNTSSLNSFITYYAYEIGLEETVNINETLMSLWGTKDHENKWEQGRTWVPGFSLDRELRLKPNTQQGFSDESDQGIIDLSHLDELWVQKVVEKNGKKILREINIRPFIEDIRWTEKDILFLLLKSQGGECCRPTDVISALFKITPGNPKVRIRRIGLFGKMDGEMISPDEITGKVEKTCLQR